MKAIIEIPQGSNYKYEVNKRTGALALDRVLNQVVPYNYGFIPNTMCEDGDELDVFVCSKYPIPPLTEVTLEVFGVLTCLDNGVVDDKIIACIPIANFEDMDYTIFDIESIKSYLNSYKPGFQVLDYKNATMANLIIDEALRKGQY